MDAVLEKYISGADFVLIDFYAQWCEPCKWVVPILEEVNKHFDGKIKLGKIDIDHHPEISKSLSILSVPTLILFAHKKEVWRMRGFEPAHQLIQTLEKQLI
jgi:thioredoxin